MINSTPKLLENTEETTGEAVLLRPGLKRSLTKKFLNSEKKHISTPVNRASLAKKRRIKPIFQAKNSKITASAN